MNVEEMRKSLHIAAIQHDDKGKLYEFVALLLTSPSFSKRSVKAIYKDMKQLGRIKEK